jgi:mannose-6-phosphate isomerase-like protein (cupin superfamily)
MAVRIVSESQIKPLELPGRNIQWIVTTETIGAKHVSANIMNCPKDSAVKSSHSHKDVEEVLYILDGEGEAWVDGEIGKFKKGDSVFFPANSKHQVRNTGNCDLITLCIFSSANAAASYVNYEEDAFAKK